MKSTELVSKNRMKRSNLHLVFQSIFAGRSITRPQLAQQTGMSVMSAGRMVDALMALGLVMEAEQADEPTQGRPPKRLRVQNENLHSIGLLLDSDGISVGIADPYGRVAHHEDLSCRMRVITVEETANMIATVVERLRAQFPQVLPVIGVSVPGLVDREEGVVRFSAQLKWRDVPLRQLLEERLGEGNVIVENDIKARTMAEKQFGVAYPYNTAVVLSIGSGIGSAVVINGEVYRGKNNLAGEIGHIVINPLGRLCDCGKIGCLQTNIAEWAILQEARLISADATMDTLFHALDADAAWARDIIFRVVTYVSVAVNLLANTYAPDAVVLCGSMIEQYPQLRTCILENNAKLPDDFMAGTFDLLFSDFGVLGNVVGACSVAFAGMLDRLIQ